MVYPDKMFQTTVLLYGFGINKKTIVGLTNLN